MHLHRWLMPLLISAALTTRAQAPPPYPAAALPLAPTAGTAPPVEVIVQTDHGALQVQLDTSRAPVTAGNFLHYVDQKRFDGSTFYRAMKVGDTGEYGLVQGGLRGNPKRVFKPIAHEPTSQTGLSHVDGAISMARAEPGTATADFFIVLGNLTTLDATASDPGYAAFGRVTKGIEVIRAMLELPRAATAPVEVMKGQMLATPVKILSVRRASVAACVQAPCAPASAAGK
jgi:peptidyl-prolyl cis-trans isomerase A (cyclophilin A)